MASFAYYSPNTHIPVLGNDQDTGQTGTSSGQMTPEGEHDCTDETQ
jgi:hypothetical protein